MSPAPKNPIRSDKRRIVTQLKVNFENLPDDPHDTAALLPQLRDQAKHIIEALSPDDFSAAELIALLSLVAPIFARTPIVGAEPKRRRLRAL